MSHIIGVFFFIPSVPYGGCIVKVGPPLLVSSFLTPLEPPKASRLKTELPSLALE